MKMFDAVRIFAKSFASHLAFAVIGIVVSKFSISFAGVVVLSACGLYGWQVTFRKAKRIKADIRTRFFKNEQEAVEEIFRDIPSWVSSSITEAAVSLPTYICSLNCLVRLMFW